MWDSKLKKYHQNTEFLIKNLQYRTLITQNVRKWDWRFHEIVEKSMK